MHSISIRFHEQPIISTFSFFILFFLFLYEISSVGQGSSYNRDRPLACTLLLGTQKEWIAKQAFIEKCPNIGIWWMQRRRHKLACRWWACSLVLPWSPRTTLHSSRCFSCSFKHAKNIWTLNVLLAAGTTNEEAAFLDNNLNTSVFWIHMHYYSSASNLNVVKDIILGL